MIRNIEKQDYKEMNHLVPKSWGKNLDELFCFYKDKDYFNGIVVEENNDRIAFGHNILFGESAWLGHILVSDKYRRMGLGSRIVTELIKLSNNKGAKSINLVATKEGEFLYRTLGFKNDEVYLFFKGKYEGIISNNIKKIAEEDFDEILELDRKMTGEDRSCEIQQYLDKGYKYEDVHGNIIGFYLGEFGQGAILAENYIAGIELIKFKHKSSEEVTVIPESNKEGVNFLKKNDFELTNTGMRMYFGEYTNWSKENVFARGKAYTG